MHGGVGSCCCVGTMRGVFKSLYDIRPILVLLCSLDKITRSSAAMFPAIFHPLTREELGRVMKFAVDTSPACWEVFHFCLVSYFSFVDSCCVWKKYNPMWDSSIFWPWFLSSENKFWLVLLIYI